MLKDKLSKDALHVNRKKGFGLSIQKPVVNNIRDGIMVDKTNRLTAMI